MDEQSVFARTEKISSRRQTGGETFNIKDLAEIATDGQKELIEDLIDNPIKCGYFLAFCESEFSAENIRFVMEIDRFKDTLLADKDAWNTGLDWASIDELLGGEFHDLSESELKQKILNDELVVGKESAWPSQFVRFEAVVQDVERIWKTFLSHNAKEQIFMPSQVLLNTKRRLENVHLYGGAVFDEALIDPIKTLRKDTLPRFVTSSYYSRLSKRLASLIPLPTANMLALPNPSKIPSAKWEDKDINTDTIYKMSLADMLHDKLLYSHFLLYCKSIFSDENLLCGRAIEIFKSHFKDSADKCPPAAEDVAWLIFRFFAAPGAVFEVSLSHRRRKELMQSLANPTYTMFDRVEESALQMLRVNWGSFSSTAVFEKLPGLILEEKNRVLVPIKPIKEKKQKRKGSNPDVQNHLTDNILPRIRNSLDISGMKRIGSLKELVPAPPQALVTTLNSLNNTVNNMTERPKALFDHYFVDKKNRYKV